jgi:hypothetical protein
LSLLGFVNELFFPIFPEINTWLFRVLYVTAHNTWAGLKRIVAHYEQGKKETTFWNESKEIIREGTSLFPSCFRNCMMHYALLNKGTPCITLNFAVFLH